MSFPLDTTDALGRSVRLEKPPRRIVSLVPSQTELLEELGMEAEVIGITRFCVHPEHWHAQKPYVGGTKDVRVERVRTLAPDLVLANKEENVREQIEEIAAFAPVYVTDVASVADAVAMVRAVGQLVNRAETADVLAAEVEADFARLPALDPIRAAYLIWREPWMTVGGDTFVHDVMAHAGLDNVFGDRLRYPEISGEELRAAAPEAVLLSSEPFPFREKHVREVQALVPDARVALVDGEAFSWYGSRLLDTPSYLAALRSELDG